MSEDTIRIHENPSTSLLGDSPDTHYPELPGRGRWGGIACGQDLVLGSVGSGGHGRGTLVLRFHCTGGALTPSEAPGSFLPFIFSLPIASACLFQLVSPSLTLFSGLQKLVRREAGGHRPSPWGHFCPIHALGGSPTILAYQALGCFWCSSPHP